MDIPRPSRGDHAEYMGAYVDLVPDGPILATLASQIEDTAALLAAAGEERGEHRYAPSKWSVKEVVGHLADTELVFLYRALRFARGDATPLPGFEQDDWVPQAGCAEQTLADLVVQLRRVRAASLAVFASFSQAAWSRRGAASGAEVVVSAFPWINAGHELHHRRILRDRYRL